MIILDSCWDSEHVLVKERQEQHEKKGLCCRYFIAVS